MAPLVSIFITKLINVFLGRVREDRLWKGVDQATQSKMVGGGRWGGGEGDDGGQAGMGKGR